MTVGLNSLDKLTLQVQKITGNEEEKQKASRILNTINDHHLFLVTLLIGNAMVLEFLPLVMHKLMPDWAAILMSTFVVVIVAQIAPMSYTTGPSKYKVAYYCAPLVNLCIRIYYIVAYPIARGLDRLLGIHDDTHIKRRDFLAFVSEKKKVRFYKKLQNYLLPLEITMFNQLFVGPKFTSAQNIMIPSSQIIFFSMNDEVNQTITMQIVSNEKGYIFVTKNNQDIHNFSILTVIEVKKFIRLYLKKSQQLRKPILKISDFISPQSVMKSSKTTENFMNGLNDKGTVQKYNEKHKIPVVYSDTGLLDLLTIMRVQNCSVVLVHKDKRRNDDTDIAYLDASDHLVLYESFSVQDKSSIIGVVMIQDIFGSIVDLKNQILPQFQTQKQVSPVKKRKLVKKASIVSAYSASSSRSFVE